MRRPALVLGCLGLLATIAPLASAAAPDRTVRLISGGTLSVNASPAGISDDGSRVLFTTTESLVAGDTNSVTDVYARDVNGTLQLISGGTGAGSSGFAGVSADGSRTWYATTNADLPADTDSSFDVYERRRDGSLRQISAGNGTNGALFVQASDDGDHVLFATSEQVPGTGDTDGAGLNDLYDRRGDNSVRLVTPGTAASVSYFSNRNVLSRDGTLAVFFTNESILPADLDVQSDSYSVSTTTGAYTLLTPGTTTGVFGSPDRTGTRVWFNTTEAVLPTDTDTAEDAYEGRADGSVHLLSGGTANTDAFLTFVSPDGDTAYFTTAEKLLPADGDTTGGDLYERRADGTLRLISGGTADVSNASILGVQADGSVSFYTSESLVPADTDTDLDVYLRLANETLVLLTPSTPAFLGLSFFTPNLPADRFGTFFSAPDLPATGDTNGVSDVFEVADGGLRLLVPGVPGGTGAASARSADGSRVLFQTASTIPGTGDGDTAVDVYEAAFAVPTLSGVPTLAGTGKVGATHTCTVPAAVGEGITRSVAWLRDGAVIAGATASTYKPVLADAGRVLRCRSIAANGIGADTADSAGRTISPAARATKLAGYPIVGTSLTCTRFAGATTTRYAWKRGTRTVRGRTSRSFKVGTADLGRRLSCTATGRKGALSTTVTHRVTVPVRCTVPGVRGLTPAAATSRLGNAGCRSKTTKVTGAGVAKGLALGTSPARGAKRANGTRITIRIRR